MTFSSLPASSKYPDPGSLKTFVKDPDGYLTISEEGILARLYNSTSRSADAHALLASALKGFVPTPEFPEIEQAQALLSALAS